MKPNHASQPFATAFLSSLICLIVTSHGAPFAPTGQPPSAALSAASQTRALRPQSDLRQIIGVTHVSGKYRHTTQPFLLEGAEILETLGTGVIKLWFNGNPGKSYPFHSAWPSNVANLVALAKHPDYVKVFSMSFSTIILECFPIAKVDWGDGLSSGEATAEATEMEDLTRYLCQTYAGTQKTFILQNWEGDNAIALKKRPALEHEAAIQGMTQWIQTRQGAVERGRKGASGVRVVHCLEMNWVPGGREVDFGAPLVVDRVAPETACDLYSISSWGTKVAGSEEDLTPKLDYIVSKTKPSALYGRKNVMVGEFGAPESIYENGKNGYPSWGNDTGLQQLEINRRQIDAALRWGAPYIVYWELYCNEWRNARGGRDTTRENQAANATAEEVRGFWLIRPDGSASPTWHYLKACFQQNP